MSSPPGESKEAPGTQRLLRPRHPSGTVRLVTDLHEDLVDAANDVYGSHPRSRALHAKGTWCEGTFTASEGAARLSRGAHLSGRAVPALVRFSNGSGDPESHDAVREARGMAVKLRPEGAGETDLLATTSRAFSNRTPEDFLEVLRLRAPDPETGKPDMEKLGAFLGDHPEMQAAVGSILGVGPPASFATLVYYSPHSFKLVDGDGAETWIRFRWRPQAGEHHLSDDEAHAKGRDYLREELVRRLAEGPVRFELLFQLAGEDDPIEDATAVWPDGEREIVEAGTLEVTAVIADPESGGDIVVFDPTRVIDGVELSGDPILHARPKAYSVSVDRRVSK
jgi:catalase